MHRKVKRVMESKEGEKGRLAGADYPGGNNLQRDKP